MKVLALFAILLVAIAAAVAVVTVEECKCFEEFVPERVAHGRWMCRGSKHSRIFGCGEEKPPLCRCYDNGREVILDIGETNCVDVHMRFDYLYCSPSRSEWEDYYNQHPYRRLIY